MEHNIKERIIEMVEENGIEIGEEGVLENIDSLQFVSLLVSVEQEFDIEIPDEYLISDQVLDIESLVAIAEKELSKINT